MGTTFSTFLGKVRRYIRLYGYFLRFSISRTLEFRLNFWFRIVMDFIYAVILIAFYQILYAQTPTLGGWSKEQAMIFVGICLVVDSIQMTFFTNGLNNLSELVNKGDLDYYLVRPVSSLFFLVLREVSLNSAINLLISFSILIYYFSVSHLSFSVLSILGFVALVLNGSLIYCLLRLLFVLPVFWLGSVRGLDSLFYNLYYCVDRPDRVFKGGVRLILVTILPFCVMASFPARVLFEGNDCGTIVHAVGVSLSLGIITYYVWKRCLRAYSSASS